jgi:hypothetical protein
MSIALRAKSCSRARIGQAGIDRKDWLTRRRHLVLPGDHHGDGSRL